MSLNIATLKILFSSIAYWTQITTVVRCIFYLILKCFKAFHNRYKSGTGWDRRVKEARCYTVHQINIYKYITIQATAQQNAKNAVRKVSLTFHSAFGQVTTAVKAQCLAKKYSSEILLTIRISIYNVPNVRITYRRARNTYTHSRFYDCWLEKLDAL